MDLKIKLSLPHCTGTEGEWIARALEQDWIVPLGPDVDEFERRLADYLGVPAVVALSSGTAAIHLALVMLGVKPGDEVICQSMTFSASANPIVYCGARPVFVDSEASTMNIDPLELDKAIAKRITLTGRKPAAIIAVDLYGMPASMDGIMAVADRYGIPVVEDAAEALGSEYKGRKCGSFGRFAALSFNGNKIITTSGGGALVCPDAESAARVKFLSTQARLPKPYYYHDEIGFNYRLSNISAAIGCSQIETVAERVERRRAIHARYAAGLADMNGLLQVTSGPDDAYRSNYWLSTLLYNKEIVDAADEGEEAGVPDHLRRLLLDEGIETRLLWRPMNMQPVFASAPYYGGTVGADLFARGLCLPSGSSLTDDQIDTVIEAIHRHGEAAARRS